MKNNSTNTRDRLGCIETRGIDFIPENERHSTPTNVFWMLAGAQFCFTLFVWGWLPIIYGLSWVSAVMASTIGLIIGSVVVAPIALFGPRTGTNTAVSSGAIFGVVGRLVGSFVALFIGIGAYALTIWTAGDALTASAHRLFGWGDGNLALAIGYLIPSVTVVIASIYGHASIIALQRYLAPAMAVLMLVGFVALAPQFHPETSGGELILGSYWPTFALAVVTALSAPISYAPFLNDYSRYISLSRYSSTRVAVAAGGGLFVGLWIAVMFGAYVAVTIADPSINFALGLVSISPLWFVTPLLVIGVFGTLGQGTLALYGTGLDTSSVFPGLTRVQATVAESIIGTVLVYLGVFVWNAVSLVTAFITLLTIFVAPLVAIMLIGYVYHRGRFEPQDLQVFVLRKRGGVYWYQKGWNPGALVAWLGGVVIGLLTSQTALFVGPWANAANGIDLSFTSSLLVGAVLYLILVRAPSSIVESGAQPLTVENQP